MPPEHLSVGHCTEWPQFALEDRERDPFLKHPGFRARILYRTDLDLNPTSATYSPRFLHLWNEENLPHRDFVKIKWDNTGSPDMVPGTLCLWETSTVIIWGVLQVTVVFIKEFFSVLTAWCKILITTSHPKFVIFPHQLTTPISVIFSPLNMGRLQISTSCPSPSWFGSWQRNLLWSVYCQVTSPWTSLPPSWYSPSLRTQPLKPSCPWTL